MLKKSFCLFLLLVLTVSVFSSCADNTQTDYTIHTTNEEVLTTEISELNDEKESETGTSAELYTQEHSEQGDVGGGVITVQKYRTVFYDIPISFINIVGKDVYYDWLENVEYPRVSEKMLMAQFVQDFDITREEFDKANLECARSIRDELYGNPCLSPKDYANQEDDEIYNGDVIYTFDDDLIREYYITPDYPYLYEFEFEEAVANGEYTSQTEEWVDVEQMEADIIAKYGEAEIVTEAVEETASAAEESTETASLPEETAV